MEVELIGFDKDNQDRRKIVIEREGDNITIKVIPKNAVKSDDEYYLVAQIDSGEIWLHDMTGQPMKFAIVCDRNESFVRRK